MLEDIQCRGLSLSEVRRYLDLSGADNHAWNELGARTPTESGALVGVKDIKDELLLKRAEERHQAIKKLRVQQQEVMDEKNGRTEDLLELQRAEAMHRESILKEKEERKVIAQELFALKREQLAEVQAATERELQSLQKERAALLARERDGIEAIAQVREQILEQDKRHHEAMQEAQRQVEAGRGKASDTLRVSLIESTKQNMEEKVNLARSFGAKTEGLRKERLQLVGELEKIKASLADTPQQQPLRVKDGGAGDAEELWSEMALRQQERRVATLKAAANSLVNPELSTGQDKGAQDLGNRLQNGPKSQSLRVELVELESEAYLEEWLRSDALSLRDLEQQKCSLRTPAAAQHSARNATTPEDGENEAAVMASDSMPAASGTEPRPPGSSEAPFRAQKGRKRGRDELSRKREAPWSRTVGTSPIAPAVPPPQPYLQQHQQQHQQQQQQPQLQQAPTSGQSQVFHGAYQAMPPPSFPPPGAVPGLHLMEHRGLPLGHSHHHPAHSQPSLANSPYAAHVMALEAETLRLQMEAQALQVPGASMSQVPVGIESEPRPPWLAFAVNLDDQANPDTVRGRLTRLEGDHVEHMRKVEYEMQRLQLEQKLADLKAEIALEKATKEKSTAHEIWLQDQKRKVEILRAEQELAREQQLLQVQQEAQGATSDSGQRPYSARSGFVVYWDYVLGLPEDVSGKVRLAFALYVGGVQHGKTGSTPWADVKAMKVGGGVDELGCILEKQVAFPATQPGPHVRVVVELQRKDSKGISARNGVGWGMLHTFKPVQHQPWQLNLRSGCLMLPLVAGHVDLRVQSPYHNTGKGKAAKPAALNLFLRLTRGNELEASERFAVDPTTSNLYRPYGNLLQARGQLDSVLYAIMFVARVRRALHRRKQPAQLPVKQSMVKVPRGKPKKNRSADAANALDKVQPEERRLSGPAEQAQRLEKEVEEEADEIAEPPQEEEEEARSEAESSEATEHEEEIDQEEPAAKMDEKAVVDTLLPAAPTQHSKAENVSPEGCEAFDVYVDGALGMPDCCTISKCVVMAYTADGAAVGDQGHALSQVSSPVRDPAFDLRKEWRSSSGNPFDTTLCLLIRVDTIERQSRELRAVGYAVLAVFLDEQKKQPAEPAAAGASLNVGNFQLPLYRAPPRLAGLRGDSLYGAAHVPCASVLVRLGKAPQQVDGGAALSTSTVREEDWKRLGVVVEAPAYAPGVYDDSEMKLTGAEKDLAEFLANQEEEVTPEKVSQVGPATFIRGKDVEPPAFDHNNQLAYIDWMTKKLEGKPKKMVDYRFTSPYYQESGFTVQVAGLTNMKLGSGLNKKPVAYKVLYSLLDPGLYYQDPPMSDQVDFTALFDPSSSQTSPHYEDPPRVYRGVAADPAQCLIIDVRQLRVDSNGGVQVEPPSSKPVSGAWALLPLFPGRRYTALGTIQVPLICGPFPGASLLGNESPLRQASYHMTTAALITLSRKILGAETLPWPRQVCLISNLLTPPPTSSRHLILGLKSKRYKLLEGSSVIVQVNNALLSGMDVLPSPWADPNIEKRLAGTIGDVVGVPVARYDFNAEDGGKPISKLAGKKTDPEAFFAKLNKEFAEATGVSFTQK